MQTPFSKYGGRMVVPFQGKTFYVSNVASQLSLLRAAFSPDEDGVTRVWETPADALTQCVSGRGDTIYVSGSHTITTALAMAKDGVRLLAADSSATLVGSASDIMDLTADGCEIAGFRLALATTKICIDMAGADRNYIHDNVFTSAVGGTASHFIRMATTACLYNVIRHNQFISNLVVTAAGVTQTSHITGLGIGNLIEENVFVAGRVSTANAGAVTSGIVFAAAADAGNIVRNNDFTEFNGATFTAGIDYGTTALGGSVLATRNNLMLATAANAIVNGSNAGDFANNIVSGVV